MKKLLDTTALKQAVRAGHTTIVNFLVSQKANVNIHGGSTALYIAVIGNKLDMVKLLLKARANKNLKSISFNGRFVKGGITPLKAAQKKGFKKIAALLR